MQSISSEPHRQGLAGLWTPEWPQSIRYSVLWPVSYGFVRSSLWLTLILKSLGSFCSCQCGLLGALAWPCKDFFSGVSSSCRSWCIQDNYWRGLAFDSLICGFCMMLTILRLVWYFCLRLLDRWPIVFFMCIVRDLNFHVIGSLR